MNRNNHTEDTFTTDLPAVSVIIISKNNHMLLQNAVASIKMVDYPSSKLQLVILEETDTPNPLEPWVEYHTIPLRHRGFGYARNTALTYARNPVIVFTDDDCTVHRNWLRALVEPLQQSETIAAVSGAIFVPPCGVIGTCENIIGFPGGGIKYYHQCKGKITAHPTFSTCNCAIKRSAIDGAGGFDESMKYGGEDERISRHIARHGTILYNPDAIVYHKPRDTISGVFNWFVRRGYAEVHHALVDKKSSYSIQSFLKNAVVLRLFIIVIVSMISRLGGVLLLPAMMVYYSILVYKFRWSFCYYPSVATLCMVPVVRTIMDIGRDWGILKGLWEYRQNKNTAIHTSRCEHESLRVGFFSNHASIIGGGELSFIDLVDQIRLYNITPVVFVPGIGEVSDRLCERGLHPHQYTLPPIRIHSIYRVILALIQLCYLLRKMHVAIAHINGARCMLLVGTCAKALRIPVIWHVRVIERDAHLDHVRALLADRIIANSNAVKKSLIPFCRKPFLISVIYNGIDVDKIAGTPPLNLQKTFSLPDKPVVLTVGRLCAWKRFHILIEACSIVNTKGIPFTCLIVGKDADAEMEYCRWLRSLPAEQGINNVVFGEWRNDVSAIMKAAAIMVLPSFNESFGRVIIEAWVCGLPVITTDSGGPAELIAHGKTGLLFPVDDTETLALNIEQLLIDAELRMSLSESGKKRAYDFTLQTHAQKVSECYRMVL